VWNAAAKGTTEHLGILLGVVRKEDHRLAVKIKT
jgi:hypothetical protein